MFDYSTETWNLVFSSLFFLKMFTVYRLMFDIEDKLKLVILNLYIYNE